MAHTIQSMERLQRELDAFPHNESVKKWREQGKKVVGWVCNYVPEELIYAAGFLPIRILGNKGVVSKGDDYLQNNMCSFIRACLGQGLEKHYDFLDGAIFAQSCDGICRLFDASKIYIKTPYVYLMDHPHKISHASRVYHYGELEKLKESLEDFSGQEITVESLQEARLPWQSWTSSRFQVRSPQEAGLSWQCSKSNSCLQQIASGSKSAPAELEKLTVSMNLARKPDCPGRARKAYALN